MMMMKIEEEERMKEGKEEEEKHWVLYTQLLINVRRNGSEQQTGRATYSYF